MVEPAEVLVDHQASRQLEALRFLNSCPEVEGQFSALGHVKSPWAFTYLRLALSIFVGYDTADKIVSEVEAVKKQTADSQQLTARSGLAVGCPL